VILHECANVIWNLKGAKRPSLFCLGYFSPSNNLNYDVKDASILHLKLGNNGKPTYFLTSTPLGHTPITMVDLLQAIIC